MRMRIGSAQHTALANKRGGTVTAGERRGTGNARKEGTAIQRGVQSL